MTDKEMIARLRSMHWCVTTEANGVGVSDSKVALDAADRIEALTKERDDFADQIANLLPAVNREAVEQRQRAEAAEAKLAKAEAGLREIAGECGCFIARATLAEIKGESHE